MPAVSYDLAIEAGATFSRRFEWREDDGSVPPAGPLIDTSDYDAYMQVKTRVKNGTVIASFDKDSGLTVAGGVISLRIGADATERMAEIAQAGVYDIELHNRTDPTDVVRLVKGKVTLDPDVTTIPAVSP